MNKLWCAVALLLLCSFGLSARIITHEIKITVHEDSSAYVEEEYVLRLDENEKTTLEQMINKELSIDDLRKFGVDKTIVLKTEGENIIPSLTQSSIAFITLQYRVPKITELIESRGRKETLAITEKAFSLYDGNKISLPYDPPTDLKILIPLKLLVSGEVTPPPYSITIVEINGEKYKEYEWNHKRPFQAEKFRVAFEKEVTLKSRLSIEVLLQDIQETFAKNPFYLIATLIVIVIIIWYRKGIVKLVGEAFAGEAVPEELEEK